MFEQKANLEFCCNKQYTDYSTQKTKYFPRKPPSRIPFHHFILPKGGQARHQINLYRAIMTSRNLKGKVGKQRTAEKTKKEAEAKD